MQPTGAAAIRFLCAASFVTLLGNQPCGPIPGGALEGPVHVEPVRDWSFSDAHPRCLVEVRPEDPHSVTTSCFADEGALYVPAIMGDSKHWTHWAIEHPHARVKIGDEIYPVTIERVEDAAARRRAARAGYRKYQGQDPPEDWETPEDRWYFRLTWRSPDDDRPGS